MALYVDPVAVWRFLCALCGLCAQRTSLSIERLALSRALLQKEFDDRVVLQRLRGIKRRAPVRVRRVDTRV